MVPLYEDLQAYIDSSAVFAVHTMTVPLLLEVGDSDGTVAWHQGIELYNVARRAGKNVVMVAYIGEDHGLRQKNEPDGLPAPHPRLVRPLPEGRAGGAVDHRRPVVPRAGSGDSEAGRSAGRELGIETDRRGGPGAEFRGRGTQS